MARKPVNEFDGIGVAVGITVGILLPGYRPHIPALEAISICIC